MRTYARPDGERSLRACSRHTSSTENNMASPDGLAMLHFIADSALAIYIAVPVDPLAGVVDGRHDRRGLQALATDADRFSYGFTS
ncbi:hypothetical protein D3C75_1109480 [compost metagenome]